MARATQLRLLDAREAFQLVAEINAIGDESRRWRDHLLTRLAALTEADLALAGEQNAASAADFGRLEGAASVGWELPAAQEAWIDWRARMRESPVTADGPALLWRDSDSIVSVRAMATSDRSSFLFLGRVCGRSPFAPRDRLLTAVVHSELARLWRRRGRQPGIPPLPRRVAQTLEGLLAGRTEKQIASSLGLSPHTVHKYVTELHRRLGVSSRGELLARCHGLSGGHRSESDSRDEARGAATADASHAKFPMEPEFAPAAII